MPTTDRGRNMSMTTVLGVFAEVVLVGEPANANTSPHLRGEANRAKRGRARRPLHKLELLEAPPDPFHSPSQTGVNALMASGEGEHRVTSDGSTSSTYALIPLAPQPKPTPGSYLDAMTVTVTY
jgi:hypothetical protein